MCAFYCFQHDLIIPQLHLNGLSFVLTGGTASTSPCCNVRIKNIVSIFSKKGGQTKVQLTVTITSIQLAF